MAIGCIMEGIRSGAGRNNMTCTIDISIQTWRCLKDDGGVENDFSRKITFLSITTNVWILLLEVWWLWVFIRHQYESLQSPSSWIAWFSLYQIEQLTLSFLWKFVLRFCRIIVKRVRMTSPQPWNLVTSSCSIAAFNLLHSCYNPWDFHELKPNFRCYLLLVFFTITIQCRLY